MYHWYLTPTLLLASLVTSVAALMAADEPPSPLDRQIQNGWTFSSFHEAIRQIEQKTGFKVSCSDELDFFMQTIWMKCTFSDEPTPTISVKMFLDQIARMIALKWQFDPTASTVTLDLPWKISDPRSASELLKAVWQPGYGTDYEKDPKWQTAFNTLLSKDANINRAWKIREKSILHRMIHSFGDDPSKPILMKQVVAASEQRYVLILVCQPIQMYPGAGSVSYYWFKEDGTLVGAGLMNTGHRCKVVDATIDNEYGANSDKTSELQMILKMNERDFFIARFVLEDDGFKLIHLVDGHGKDVDNDGLNVGQSLMEPDKQ